MGGGESGGEGGNGEEGVEGGHERDAMATGGLWAAVAGHCFVWGGFLRLGWPSFVWGGPLHTV
jgi:hypothetical protein